MPDLEKHDMKHKDDKKAKHDKKAHQLEKLDSWCRAFSHSWAFSCCCAVWCVLEIWSFLMEKPNNSRNSTSGVMCFSSYWASRSETRPNNSKLDPTIRENRQSTRLVAQHDATPGISWCCWAFLCRDSGVLQ